MLARGMIGVVKLYRVAIGPYLPKVCRFEPSCSTYALEALEQHGAVRGGWLAARRLARCHPWGGHGFDPVPGPKHAARVRESENAERTGAETPV